MSNANPGEGQKSPVYDVVIVGGGVSGIYSGWRLMTAKPWESPQLKSWVNGAGKLKVAVFEGSDRIGGRLLSARPPGFPDTTTCEIGGMRYVSSQTLVRSLVENELELPNYLQHVYSDDAIVYLRGKQMRFSQVRDVSLLPYNLEWAEKQFVLNNDPAGLIAWAISKLLPGVNQFKGNDLQKYLQHATVDGTPLFKHGFWNLLARALSPDAYEIARALIGYDCLGSNANAVDLILEIYDFAPTVTYHLLKQGYETVPWELQKRFVEAGGDVIDKTWVASFDHVTLEDGSTGVEIHFRDGHRPITARAIILAMPRRSLELLDRKGPVFDPSRAPGVSKLLSSVRAIPLYKLFLAYEYPWWNALAVPPKDPNQPTPPLQGRSLTDTPVRQLYYWPIDPDLKTQPMTGAALLMAYNDATNVDFWEGLSGVADESELDADSRQARERRLGHIRKVLPSVPMYGPRVQLEAHTCGDDHSHRLLKNWYDHRAPQEMVMEMHRQVKRMHNIQYAPKPVAAAYMDWSIDPYGGGVHFWNRGFESWKYLYDVVKPVEDFPCYICGEAYSTNQTWVEGALQTAEIVLQEHFGLPAPSWITPNV